MTALKARIKLQLLLYSQTIYQTAKNFRKMDRLEILQWNCLGLNNKISYLIIFSAEENIDVICLNEVKNRKKSTPLNNYRCDGNLQKLSSWPCHLIEEKHCYQANRTSRNKTDSKVLTLETLKLCLKLHLFDDFG